MLDLNLHHLVLGPVVLTLKLCMWSLLIGCLLKIEWNYTHLEIDLQGDREFGIREEASVFIFPEWITIMTYY